MGNDNGWGIIAGFLFLVGCLIGTVAANLIVNHDWKKMAIEKGAAQYNAQTGDFEWK